MLQSEIANAKTIPEALFASAGLFGRHTAMRFKTGPEDFYSGKYAYSEVASLLIRIGTAFSDAFALEKNRKIAFISENRAEYNLCDYGVMSVGCVPWGLYDYDMKNADAVAYKLCDSESEIIVASPAFLENVRHVTRTMKTPVRKIVVIDSPHERVELHDGEILLSELLQNVAPDERFICERLSGITRDDVARLIYTSGTTGVSKGVMLSHGNLLTNVEGTSQLYENKPGERFVSYLPEAHSFQGILTLYTLLNGGEIWYTHKKTLVGDIAMIQPHMFPGVPMVYKRFAEGIREKILHLTKGLIDLSVDYSRDPLKRFIRRKVVGPLALKKAGLGKIIRAVSGSAKLDTEHARILENIGLYVLEGYGISETSPVISIERAEDPRRGSVGKPIPGVDVRILSLEPDQFGRRRQLPPGEHGEVVCKGPNVFKGYFKDEERTKRAFYDGYYLTGDLGHIDKDGFLYIHGRCGLQVKMANGEFVNLDELAADLLRHTTLVQAAAIDAELKEYAVAVVSIGWEPELLSGVAEKLGVPFSGNAAEFARNEMVISAVKKELGDNRDKFGDPRVPKTPRKFLIVPPMSPETGEITSTLKSRVKFTLDKYRDRIDQLRNGDSSFMVAV